MDRLQKLNIAYEKIDYEKKSVKIYDTSVQKYGNFSYTIWQSRERNDSGKSCVKIFWFCVEAEFDFLVILNRKIWIWILCKDLLDTFSLAHWHSIYPKYIYLVFTYSIK